jgi:hypothetical protein
MAAVSTAGSGSSAAKTEEAKRRQARRRMMPANEALGHFMHSLRLKEFRQNLEVTLSCL